MAKKNTATFLGPSKGLVTAGDYAYAIASVIGASDTSATQLKFTTGNYLFVGRWTCNGSARADSPPNGNATVWTMTFNGSNVALIKTDSAEEDSPSTIYNDIIIPPLTEVEVVCESNSVEGSNLTSCLMTGRIYREA